MPITLDPTVAGASANTYTTVAEVDAFALSADPVQAAAWAALATDDAKAPFMVRAARLLDTIPFDGAMASTTQALQWPRNGVPQPVVYGDLAYYGAYYPMTEIPPCVKTAHAALSVYLAANSTTDPFAGGDAGALSGLKVGPIQLSYRVEAGTFPSTGRDYLQREILPILAAGNVVGSSREVRLTR